MDNLIKAHKLHLASDRTSCSKATVNQFQLRIHTAAYWLLHTLRGLAPKASFWREAQFDTLRLGLIKVAARVAEINTRIMLSLPTSFPYQESLAVLAARTVKLPPRTPGQLAPASRNPVVRVVSTMMWLLRSLPSMPPQGTLFVPRLERF